MIRAETITEAEARPKSRGISDIALGRAGLFLISPADLRIQPGLNSRVKDFDPADEEDLALSRSVAEYGVKQPLTIHWREGAAWITDGHRRYGAVMHAIATGAEIKSVPVQSEGQYATEADRVFSQIVRNSGKPLQPIEQARVFKKLIDLGWHEKGIATKAGLTRQRVVDLLNLQAAPREVVAMVEAGEVSATLASQTIKAEGEGATEKLVSAVTTAKAAGKSRATAKHVSRPAPDLTKSVAYQAGLKRAVEIIRSAWEPDELPIGMARIIENIEAEIAK
jgi:ParB/RepB/Spo0J family partition protein